MDRQTAVSKANYLHDLLNPDNAPGSLSANDTLRFGQLALKAEAISIDLRNHSENAKIIKESYNSLTKIEDEIELILKNYGIKPQQVSRQTATSSSQTPSPGSTTENKAKNTPASKLDKFLFKLLVSAALGVSITWCLRYGYPYDNAAMGKAASAFIEKTKTQNILATALHLLALYGFQTIFTYAILSALVLNKNWRPTNFEGPRETFVFCLIGITLVVPAFLGEMLN